MLIWTYPRGGVVSSVASPFFVCVLDGSKFLEVHSMVPTYKDGMFGVCKQSDS